MTQKTRTARPDRSKTTRTPLGQRNRLTFNDLEEGYSYRVINDAPGRIQAALDGGYEYVHSSERLGDTMAAEASPMDSRVTKQVGDGKIAYLMRIKQEWYDEDQKIKAAEVDKTEAAMNLNTKKAEGKFDHQVYGPGLQDG